jgi:hypothetical protein
MARSRSKVTFNVPLARAVVDEAAERGVRAATLEAQRIVQREVLSHNPPRSGRLYPRGQRMHQASAPGESPAPDTGQLRNTGSVEFERGLTGPQGKLVFATEKAAALELGTERMAPRPFLSRIPREFAARIRAAFVAAARR